jgi:hypothetical protein
MSIGFSVGKHPENLEVFVVDCRVKAWTEAVRESAVAMVAVREKERDGMRGMRMRILGREKKTPVSRLAPLSRIRPIRRGTFSGSPFFSAVTQADSLSGGTSRVLYRSGMLY